MGLKGDAASQRSSIIQAELFYIKICLRDILSLYVFTTGKPHIQSRQQITFRNIAAIRFNLL